MKSGHRPFSPLTLLQHVEFTPALTFFPTCSDFWLDFPPVVRMACEIKLLESEATTRFFVLLGEQGNKAVLDCVMKEGLIPSRYECPKCKKDMRLVERKGTIDGFEWRCRVQSKENPHFVCRSKREEVRPKSLFVEKGGVRKRAKNRQFSYYICNRSGIAKLKSEGKCHEKIGGSVKCGKTCPAFMTAIREQKEEAIKITVQYQSVHAGHEMQVGKLRLHQEDRRNLAALLKIGVPYTNIIENIQKKCPPTERFGLLTKKDLHNVSRDFEVDESILHGEDSNRLSREKEAILKENEKSVVHEEPTESSQVIQEIIFHGSGEALANLSTSSLIPIPL
ncbi:c2H2-type domain-containing protein [Trichonephila clavipes]|nr:c2H2-type domain-containing protein [Trichonephila clavipes]